MHVVCLLVAKTDVPSLVECVSSYNTLKIITAWMNHFVQDCLAHSTNDTPLTGLLTTSELAFVEKHWIISVQGSVFPD